MAPEELRTLRASWGLTQAQMATYMGLNRRAYIGLEVGERPLRLSHILSIERISMDVALDKADTSLIPQNLLKKIHRIFEISSQSGITEESTALLDEDADDIIQHNPLNEETILTSEAPKTSHNRHIDHNAILDRWAAGWGIKELANYGQTSEGTIYDLVRNYRRKGDQRAASRKK